MKYETNKSYSAFRETQILLKYLFTRSLLLIIYLSFNLVELFFNFDFCQIQKTELANNTFQIGTFSRDPSKTSGPQRASFAKKITRLNKRFHPKSIVDFSSPIAEVFLKYTSSISFAIGDHTTIPNFYLLAPSLRGPPMIV